MKIKTKAEAIQKWEDNKKQEQLQIVLLNRKRSPEQKSGF